MRDSLRDPLGYALGDPLGVPWEIPWEIPWATSWWMGIWWACEGSGMVLASYGGFWGGAGVWAASGAWECFWGLGMPDVPQTRGVRIAGCRLGSNVVCQGGMLGFNGV